MSRGRGRGTGLTFNAELLGVGRGSDFSLGTGTLTPPPKYPPLVTKPISAITPLLQGPQQQYLLTLKKQFISNIKSSQYNLKGPQPLKSSELNLHWKTIPQELQNLPHSNKTKKTKDMNPQKPNLIKRKAKEIDFEALEAKEKKLIDKGEGEQMDANETRSDNEDERVNGEDSNAEDEDQDMDEGTDYANNYFDNGEDYLDDDDDNLDEGGIY